MSRFSSVVEFSPTGTVITAAQSANSNAVSAEAAQDGRVYVNVATLAGGTTLDVEVHISHDGTDYAKVAAFNQITTTGVHVLALDRHQLGSKVRLKYTAGAAGNVTLGAKFEKKQGA